MPHMCFSYPPDVPPPSPGDLRRMPFSCFSYPAMCFGYPDKVRLGTGNRAATPPDLRRMPTSICFRY